MSILITGGAGFIGSHLARSLIAQGREVTLFDRDFRTGRLAGIEEQVTRIPGDIARPEQVRQAFAASGAREVFHCAALVSKACEENPPAAFEVNVTGTINLLEAARAAGVERVLLMSTIGTFGDHVGEPVANDAAQYPRTLYGITKVFAERLAEHYHRRYGLDCRGVRLPSVIGPGRFTKSGSAYSTMMIEYAALGRPYTIRAGEDSTLPLLYIEDAVRAVLGLCEAPAQSLTRRFYNLGGFAGRAGDIREEIRKHIPDAHLTFKAEPDVEHDLAILHKVFDDSKARDDWGWKFRYDLPASVSDFIRIVRDHPDRYGEEPPGE